MLLVSNQINMLIRPIEACEPLSLDCLEKPKTFSRFLLFSTFSVSYYFIYANQKIDLNIFNSTKYV